MQGWIPRRMAEEYFNVRESIDFFEAQARAARENIQDRGAGVAQLLDADDHEEYVSLLARVKTLETRMEEARNVPVPSTPTPPPTSNDSFVTPTELTAAPAPTTPAPEVAPPPGLHDQRPASPVMDEATWRSLKVGPFYDVHGNCILGVPASVPIEWGPSPHPAVAWPPSSSTAAPAAAGAIEEVVVNQPTNIVIEAAADDPPDDPPSSSSSSSSSTSSDRGRDRKKKKKKKVRSRTTSSSSRRVVRVKATDMKLGSWPTALQFAAWRRSLRLAVAGSCDEPDLAKKWIFEVEKKEARIEDFRSNRRDPLRALDGKLADALARIARGEPARRIAIEAERAALNADLLSGRQTLWLIYREFARDDSQTDYIAYSNLEKLQFSGAEAQLESFLSSWDNLLLSFKTMPTESHLYSAFSTRVKRVFGLSATMEHIGRQPDGHPDRSYAFLMAAARRLVEVRRTEKQNHELAKLYTTGGGTHEVAMAAPKAGAKDKKQMPCFKMRDNGSCTEGAKCEYSHDKAIIEAAKKKKKEYEDKKNNKGGNKGDKKGSKGNGKGSGKAGKAAKIICRDYNNPAKGCLRGSACNFLHEQPAMAVPRSVPAAPAAAAPASAGASS